jgi:hypothetical protein
MIYNYDTIWGVKVVNTTPHKITFMHNGESREVEPSGKILNAVREEEITINKHGIELVEVKTKATADGLRFLEAIPDDTIVIGSVIAARAYPGLVKMLVPCAGFERAPIESRRMLHNRFAIFSRKE